MLLTRKELKEYLTRFRISIPKKLEYEILEQYGVPAVDDAGHIFEYSEQDISEQVRKIIQNYQKERRLTVKNFN